MAIRQIDATEHLVDLLSSLSGDDRAGFFETLHDLIDCARDDVLPDPGIAVEDWNQREGN